MIARLLTGAAGPWIAGIAAAGVAALLAWALWLRADAAQLPAVQQQLTEAQDALQRERKAHSAALQDIRDQLQREQAASLALGAERTTLAGRVAHLTEDIRNAKLTAPPVAPVNGVCPGHPVAGADFERLYNAAARAGSAAAATAR